MSGPLETKGRSDKNAKCVYPKLHKKITHVFIVPNGESAAHITIIFISGDNILNHESKLTVLEKFIWSVNWDGVSKKKSFKSYFLIGLPVLTLQV